VSIDARIVDVTRNADGTATLHLEAADSRRAPAGQSSLTVLNPPPHLEAAVGTEIWGGSDKIVVGRETIWADRVGYGSIRLRPAKRSKP
jgi:hypothetical protein